MNRALLDTDLLSEVIKQKDPAVRARCRAYLLHHDRFTTSSVTVMEIVKGWRLAQRDDRIDEFMRFAPQMDILVFDTAAAERAGRLEADLRRAGQPIGRADSMIAAIAMVHGLELVTGNIDHYARFHSLGYRLPLVNWRSPAP